MGLVKNTLYGFWQIKRIDYQRTGGIKKKPEGLKNAYTWDNGEEAFEWWLNSERHK